MGGISRTLASEYDAGSRRIRLTFPDNNYFSYDYDAAGRLTAICELTADCENDPSPVASFGYDDLGRREDASFSGVLTSYGYDDLSRLDSLTHDLAGTAADQSLTFAYNPASQIVTRTRSNDAYASTTITNESRGYGVNGLNQYTSVGGTVHLYDPNGNLSSDGTTSYGYDAENRLVAASGTKTATLVYDPLGRLFETAGSAGTGTTQFLYDGDRLVAEYDGNGNLERRYVHGPGADEPVLWYEGAGLASPRGLFANHQGSIVAVADASGAALAINGYDAWGVPNPGNLGRFQYTGQAWLPELGLYHYKARIYSPGLGRFLQTDPVGYDDQLNLYAYVANDPINLFDPNGKERKGLFAALLDNTTISVGLSFGVNAEVSTPMGGVAIGTGEISLSGSTTLSGTDQMEVTTRPPHVGAHLGGPGIGMPTVTTTVTDRDDSTGADRFREEVSESGFKETTNAAGEKEVSAEGRPARVSLGAGLKVTIEVDVQAAFYEAALPDENPVK